MQTTKKSEICKPTAAQSLQRIKDGLLTSSELVSACLQSIQEQDHNILAWTHCAEKSALKKAEDADKSLVAGEKPGRLHGIPIAIKDIIDTRDMPTENGTPIHKDRQPKTNAAVVDALLKEGAIILGKTVTAELAVLHPGPTRNPLNLAHTPGGSSSGSAAAVAAHMVPIALGTQTTGSVIRPAAFCGIYGFKPSYGLISLANILAQAPELDTIGVFARSLDDLALATDCLIDNAPGPLANHKKWQSLQDATQRTPSSPPTFAFIKSPVWPEAEEFTKSAFQSLAESLGNHCEEVVLTKPFEQARAWQRMLQAAGCAKHFGPLLDHHPDKISAVLTAMIEEGRAISQADLQQAVANQNELNEHYEKLTEAFDAVITPSAPGPAPKGIETTGSPAFCALWTYMQVPALNLPLLNAPSGLPLGVQLAGKRYKDAELLTAASWLVDHQTH